MAVTNNTSKKTTALSKVASSVKAAVAGKTANKSSTPTSNTKTTSTSSSSGKSTSLSNGGTRTYSSDGKSYTDYDSKGNWLGGGTAGTENYGAYKSSSSGGSSSSNRQTGSSYSSLPTPGSFKLSDNATHNAYLNAQIRDKAQRGEALQTETPDKVAAYKAWQDYYTNEVKRKAGLGLGLTSANPWKQSIYDDEYKRTHPDEFLPSMSEQMYGKLTGQMGDMMNPMADWTKWYQSYAQQQAQQQFQSQKTQLEGLISSLQGQQDTALKGVQNWVKDSEQALEDSTFQDYLASRQSIANRGLSGSGLAADADTRLEMARQRNLSGIYRDAEQQSFGISQDYASKLNEAYQNIANLNPDATANEIFMQLFTDGQNKLLQQSQIYSDMWKTQMGYDNITATDQAKLGLEQQALDLDKYKHDSGLEYDYWSKAQDVASNKYNTDAQIQYQTWQTIQDNIVEVYKSDQDFQAKMAELGLKEREIQIAALKADRDYSVEMSKASGYLVGADGNYILDSSGNKIPTVDKMKVDETIRNNMFNNNLDYSDVMSKISDREFDNQLNQQRLEFDWAKLEAQTVHWANQDANAAELTRLKGEDLARKIDKDIATVAIAQDKAQSTKNGQALKAAIAEMNNLGSIMKSEIAKSKDGKPSEKTKKAYAAAQKKVNSLVQQLSADAGGGSDFQMGLQGGW